MSHDRSPGDATSDTARIALPWEKKPAQTTLGSRPTGVYGKSPSREFSLSEGDDHSELLSTFLVEDVVAKCN